MFDEQLAEVRSPWTGYDPYLEMARSPRSFPPVIPEDSASPPEITCSPTAFLLRILARAEQCRTTELWSYGTMESTHIGDVLLSHGLVCLVTLANGQIPLGVRITQRYPETAAILRDALFLARDQGRPLGDVLVELGGIAMERIREALLDQVADGLFELARAAPSGLIQVSLSTSQRRLASVLTGFAPRVVYWHTIGRLLALEEDTAGVCH